jgi:hypothetical protein
MTGPEEADEAFFMTCTRFGCTGTEYAAKRFTLRSAYRASDPSFCFLAWGSADWDELILASVQGEFLSSREGVLEKAGCSLGRSIRQKMALIARGGVVVA